MGGGGARRPPVEAASAESLTVDLRSGDVECAGAMAAAAPNADAVAGAGAGNAAAPLLVRAGRVS